jgi:broad specificity phosphatase PhoE
VNVGLMTPIWYPRCGDRSYRCVPRYPCHQTSRENSFTDGLISSTSTAHGQYHSDVMTITSSTTISLFRHPRTLWNDEQRYQGWLDSPLSPKGLDQIESIGKFVTPGMFEVVYTSPLGRARTLAERIASSSNCPLETDARLIEIGMGLWQGLTRTQIEAKYGDTLRRWHSVPTTVRFPEGETILDVARRVLEFMSTVFSGSRRGIAVVSHDAVIKVALMRALGLSYDRLHALRISNGSISVLRGSALDGSVELINGTQHLARVEDPTHN